MAGEEERFEALLGGTFVVLFGTEEAAVHVPELITFHIYIHKEIHRCMCVYAHTCDFLVVIVMRKSTHAYAT